MALQPIFVLLSLPLLALALPPAHPPLHLPTAHHSPRLSIVRSSSLPLRRSPGSTFFDGRRGHKFQRFLASPDRPPLRKPSPPPPRPEPTPPQNNTAVRPPLRRGPKHEVATWFSGLVIGMGAGAFSALLLLLSSRLLWTLLRAAPEQRKIIFQHKWLKARFLAFLDKKDALEGTEILGQGASGKVYKAVLENGKVVAIKKVIPLVNDPGRLANTVLEKSYDLTKNTKQIHAELNTLGRVRHKNLVALLAYVVKADAHLLIYDFKANGSLHDALRKVADGSLNLTWPMRHNIAVGVAMGLKYLHFDCNPRIVHRDIKPGNILLDEEFEAHLGDFGLAKLLPDSFTHYTSENVAGTVGYIAPEYHQTLKYTSKGDIFSFGVVLTVLLLGKEPSAELFSDVQTNMGDWVRDLSALGREAILEQFDPSLRHQGFEDEMILAFKIAGFCVDGSPSDRPSSSEVLVMLRQIRPPLSSP